jgi:vacuolar-type H+-ATPase subunit H
LSEKASKTKSAPANGTHNGTSNGVDASTYGRAVTRSLPLKGTYNPVESEAVDVFRLLDQLEELPEKAKHLPFNTLLGFDHEQFYYLVLKIRANLPDDMKKAQRVARDSERIVDEARDVATQQLESGRVEATRLIEEARADVDRQAELARAEANRIVESARQQASAMIDKNEIVRMATSQAHEIIRSAETEASEIRKGADDYAKDVLSNLETVMGKAISTVQRGRETLDRARG